MQECHALGLSSLSLMDYDQDDENKLKFLKNAFSFLEIDGMGRRFWKDALITRSICAILP